MEKEMFGRDRYGSLATGECLIRLDESTLV
jgi:hypothetical protein